MATYAIEDLNAYAYGMRHLSANEINKNYTENLEDFINLPQLTSLIIEYSQGYDEHGNILIDEETNEELFYIVCDWIYGVGLSKLASQNLIECAWDNEQNCMVFWSSEQSQNKEDSNGTKAKPNFTDKKGN